MALEQGKLIEAIKLLRKTTGLGLKEAKDALEQLAAQAPRPTQTVRPAQAARPASPEGKRFTPDALPTEAQQALRHGNKIDAIRIVREKTGLGLKEAKDAVDAFERAHPNLRGGLSPGEVPPEKAGYGILVLAAIAAFLAWWFFR